MSKPGSGGVASAQQADIARRQRLRQMVIDSADLSNDPYLMKNHLGSYECRLCLTLHTTEGSYLAHTQAKRHQQNLARRQAKMQQDAALSSLQPPSSLQRRRAASSAQTARAGTPGYRIVKQRHPVTHALSLLFSVSYPLILSGLQPRHRFMSTFEQQREAKDTQHQYVLIAAQPYAVIAFKIPNKEIDRSEGGVVSHWNDSTKNFMLQVSFTPPAAALRLRLSLRQ